MRQPINKFILKNCKENWSKKLIKFNIINKNSKILNYSKLKSFKQESKLFKNKISSSKSILTKYNSDSPLQVNAFAQVINARNKLTCSKISTLTKADNYQK